MRRWSRWALAVAVPVGLVLVLKLYVADVYRVDSGSMEPTIHGPNEGAELVLVRYDADPELERNDLVVLLRPAERQPIVKRVVGLPGEELQIQNGDLVIDGKKLGPRDPRPPAILIFDSDDHPLAQHFELSGGWSQGSAGSAGSPLLAVQGGAVAQASWRGELNDDYLDPSGARVPGRQPVGDAVIECRMTMVSTRRGGNCTLSLSEEGDLFELEIEPRAAGHCKLTLTRSGEGEREVELGSVTLSLGDAVSVRFANVDDALTVDANGKRVLEVAALDNRPLVGASDERLRHRRPRIALTSVALELEIQELRVLRDLFYGDFGDIGVKSPVRLGNGELFCLGDHSSESVDGRTFGPVRKEEVLGFPLAVLWPPSHARRLQAVELAPPLREGVTR
jgi:signal peptidase I